MRNGKAEVTLRGHKRIPGVRSQLVIIAIALCECYRQGHGRDRDMWLENLNGAGLKTLVLVTF